MRDARRLLDWRKRRPKIVGYGLDDAYHYLLLPESSELLQSTSIHRFLQKSVCAPWQMLKKARCPYVTNDRSLRKRETSVAKFKHH